MDKLNPADRDSLVAEYLPRVREIAETIRENLPVEMPLEDLIQTGMVGLLEAAERMQSGSVNFWTMQSIGSKGKF